MAALREPRGQAGSTKDVIVIVGASIGVSAAGAGTPGAQRVQPVGSGAGRSALGMDPREWSRLSALSAERCGSALER